MPALEYVFKSDQVAALRAITMLLDLMPPDTLTYLARELDATRDTNLPDADRLLWALRATASAVGEPGRLVQRPSTRKAKEIA